MRTAASLAVVSFAVLAACSSSDDKRSDPGPCLSDEAEPNDSAGAKRNLGTLSDDSTLIGPDAGGPTGSIKKSFTAHVPGDVDWYEVDVLDTGIGGNPQLSVVVTATYEATVWFTCTGGTTESVVCGLGEKVEDDPEFQGKGCKTGASAASSVNVNLSIECAGTSSDDGKLTIRVKRREPAAACDRYALSVFAE